MPKKAEEKIHILSPARAYLAPAKVMGPIVHPLVVPKSVAVQILLSGAEVHEYIPTTKKTIKLTLGNINDPARYEAAITKKPEVEPIVVTPVTRVGVPNIPAPEVKPVQVVENPAPAPVVEPVAPVVETTINDEPQQEPAFSIEFVYNEDGTVDETKIDWTKYSKNQRKEIRAKIIEHNATIVK